MLVVAAATAFGHKENIDQHSENTAGFSISPCIMFWAVLIVQAGFGPVFHHTSPPPSFVSPSVIPAHAGIQDWLFFG